MERRPDVDLAAVAALLRRVFGRSPTFERTADGVSWSAPGRRRRRLWPTETST